MSYGFDADRLLVWLAPREPDADPLRAGGLCKRHADAMVVPRGWTLDDRREPGPRLFRPTPAPTPEAQERTRPSGRRSPPKRHGDQLDLARASGATASAEQDQPATVADVAGPSPSDDPDETQAIPWLPDVDDDDDLGGVLAPESPLLARAFKGTDRPRD